MKTLPVLTLPLALLLLADGASAEPFTVRPVPAGFDAAGEAGARFTYPMAADFLGNGRLQWYQGGNVITRFPEAGTITLPAITLPQTPGATARPLAAAVCDVDRDGDPDIVRINEWNGNAFLYTLQVFRNNGAGGFTLGSRIDWINSFPAYDEGTHWFAIVPADFDKDGRVDLVIKEAYSNMNLTVDPYRHDGKIYIRWNDGQGGFDSSTSVEASGVEGFSRLSVADCDRDGDPDIFSSNITTSSGSASGNATTTRSRLYFNDADRSPMVTYIFPSVMPSHLGDIDGDSWPDLADCSDQATNDGTGRFTTPFTHYTGPCSNPILADYEDNGTLYAVFADNERLLVKSPQTFTGNGAGLMATMAADIDGIGAADSDGDGDTDYFVSMQNGTFAFVENRRLHTVPGASLSGSVNISGAGRLCSADFNLDGRDDVVTVAAQGFWLTSTAAAGVPGTSSYKSTGEAPAAVVAEDFDVDGRPDVAYALTTGSALRIARNTSDISAAWTDTTVVPDLTGVSLLATGSVSSPNGRPDLFTYATDSFIAPPTLRGYRQSTAGGWTPLDYLAPSAPAPRAIAVGNNTGAPGDEIAYLGGDSSVRTIRGAMFLIGGSTLGGNGVSEPVTAGYEPAYRLVWADTTGSSFKEAVYINGSGGLSSWDPASGYSTVLGTAPSAIRDIAAVDWNCDGHTDILAATASGLSLYYYRVPAQQWVRSELLSLTGGYTFLTIMNQNGDGFPDAAATTPSGRVDYIRNAPSAIRAVFDSPPPPVTAVPGTTVTALTLPLLTDGRQAQNGAPADASAVLTECRLYFQEAVSGPGGWTPGDPINGAGVSLLAGTISVEANGTTLMSAPGSAALDSGELPLKAATQAPVVPVAPGATVNHNVRLAIRATAAQAFPRFFVSVVRGTSTQQGQAMQRGLALNGNAPVLVTIQSPLSPLQQWRSDHFGQTQATGTAANNADPDNDGVPNLLEFVLNTNPRTPDPAGIAQNNLTWLTPAAGQNTMRLRLVVSNAALSDPKVRVSIEAASGLIGFNPFASRTGGGTWTGPAPQTSLTDSGNTTTHIFPTSWNPATSPRYFARLKAEELP